jgi:hypothetical protein
LDDLVFVVWGFVKDFEVIPVFAYYFWGRLVF